MQQVNVAEGIGLFLGRKSSIATNIFSYIAISMYTGKLMCNTMSNNYLQSYASSANELPSIHTTTCAIFICDVYQISNYTDPDLCHYLFPHFAGRFYKNFHSSDLYLWQIRILSKSPNSTGFQKNVRLVCTCKWCNRIDIRSGNWS